MNNFIERILEKIDNGKTLLEHELQKLIWNYEIETDYGENGRWSRFVRTIVKLGERTFAVDWEQGLTESQPDEYHHQPVEVILRTYEKTITVNEWIPIKQEEK